MLTIRKRQGATKADSREDAVMTLKHCETTLPDGVSVVVPIFNSADTLTELLGRIISVLKAREIDFEVILVNDGSSDNSWELVKTFAIDDRFIRGINLRRNFGQHNALLCGLRSARYGTTVTMDDDLQHSPEEIPKLLETLDQGYDVVYGAPEVLTQSVLRNFLSSRIKHIAARASGIASVKEINSFRALKTNLRDSFRHLDTSDVFIDAILAWTTSRFGVVTIEHNKRSSGVSNYSLVALTNQTLKMLTAYTIAPLRVAILIGSLFIGFGGIVFLYVVTRYFLQGSVPGFPFIASIISLFAGAQLFALGIIGEYVGRIFQRTTGRPAYVVENTMEAPGDGET